MARPRTFDPDEVLRLAVDLFWEKGYCDASVDEVIRRSGVAKYGIYGVFGSKRELFKSALKRYAHDRHRDIQAPIRNPKAALPEVREFFFNAAAVTTKDQKLRGCLIVNSGVELGLRDMEIRDFVADFFDETGIVMERCLNNAVEQGQLARSEDIPAMASYLVNEFRTVLMLAASGASKVQIENHISIALRVLD